MHPLFSGNESRQRRINLGGTSAVASHDELLQQARAIRNERQQARQRQEAAIRLQAAWRGQLSRRAAKEGLRVLFDENPSGLNAMRCLVLLRNDEERLGRWSEAIISMGEASLLDLARGPEHESWLVLIRQLSVTLLRSVANNPQSKAATSHLKIVYLLMSPASIDEVLPSMGIAVSKDISLYLLRHGYYSMLKKAVERIPQSSSKKSATLPLLVSLFTAPLLLFPNRSESYLFCFGEIIQYILTVPLLPNRLPLDSLKQLSAQLPLQSFDLLVPMFEGINTSLETEQKINLLANLTAFMPPRYSRISASVLNDYLEFISKLLIGFPAAAFEASTDASSRQASWNQDSSSDEEDDAMGQLSTRKPTITVDAKTRSRLQTLASQNHVASLINATTSDARARLSLYKFFMALYEAWPSRSSKLLTTVLASGGSGLVRELYRGYVRSSPLGKDDSVQTLVDSSPENAQSWLSLIFLTDLYTQTLMTMGDDEFFASRPGAVSVPQAQRNPLTVDEVIAFSRQLMNITFVLIWHLSMDENDTSPFKGNVPGITIGWEAVRDKVTRLVQAIHDRDSRRPFTPSGHWLASRLDLASFANIAVAEEQKLSEEEDSTSSRLPPRNRLTRRKLAQISPRLNVLHQLPFAIPFETRVHIFRQFVVNDMTKENGGYDRFDRAYNGRMKSRATVRRGLVAADGFDKLANANLKGHIEITFIDQFGQEEAGIDGGGVFKEFFTELCKEVFDTDHGLWLATQKNELYPNPHSYAKEPHSLEWYRFIGRILGKALYEGILVDVAFAGFFLAKWLGKQSFLDDLASLSPELYKGLLFLKNYTGDPEELSLTFAVNEEELGVASTVDLIPNGANIPVTRDNRLQYIFLMCHYRLTKQIRPQSEAFFQGLSEMIDPKWIRMFNQQELQVLIGGVNSPIDLDDLRRHTNYGGLYSDDDDTIQAFWRVVNSLDQEKRRALLRFATSCSRPPLLGFKELQPNFSIRDAGTDQNRLPTASTCVNLLKLPRYTTEHTLREKLVQAITSGAGFDLS